MKRILLFSVIAVSLNSFGFSLFPETTLIKLRGEWKNEPQKLMHRGITVGDSWAAKPCNDSYGKNPGEVCLGQPISEFTSEFDSFVYNLPSIGVTEMWPTKVTFDNSGRVTRVRTVFPFEEYQKIKAALIDKYGDPTLKLDNGSYISDLDPMMHKDIRDWTYRAFKREEAKPDSAEAVFWTGKNYAVMLDRFYWEPNGGPDRNGAKRPQPMSETKPLASLVVFWLPTFEQFQANSNNYSQYRVQKKYQEWNLNPTAAKENL